MAEELELKDVVEKINGKFDEFKKANDKAIEERTTKTDGTTAETQAMVDKINEDITELRKTQNELEKRSKRPSNQEKGDLTPEQELRTSAYIKYIRHGIGGAASVQYTPEETRALAGTSDADGQFLVPIEFESELLMNAFDLAVIRPLCQVGTTSRDIVQLGALSKPSVAWGKRAVAVSQQDLSTGGKQIRIRNLKALTLISNDTLDDAEADVMSEVRQAFEMAVAEAEDDAFAVGTDEDSPPGIMANTAVLANYEFSKVADAISDATYNGIDVLLDMVYALNSKYRRNATFAMNSTTESLYRQLKDGEGKYLWQPSVQAGVPVALIGRPVINPEGMADVAANSYPVVIGDFRSGYKIRDRSGLVITRLVERYAEYDQTGLLLKKRVGGQVVLPEAFIPLKIATS